MRKATTSAGHKVCAEDHQAFIREFRFEIKGGSPISEVVSKRRRWSRRTASSLRPS